MQEAQLSNVKPDGNYPELVSHLQYSQFLELFVFGFFFNFFLKDTCDYCGLTFKDLFAF